MIYRVKKDFKKIKNVYESYVVADFDRTLTKGNSKTSWSLLSNTNLLPNEYVQERQALYNKYRPIEIDISLPFDYRLEQMNSWFREHIELFVKYNLKESYIKEVASNLSIMEFRDGAKEFIRYLYQNQIPLIIISAGIGNFIKSFLEKEECYYSNVHIVSNMIKFRDGVAIGVENNVIHSLNKNEVSLTAEIKEKLSKRNNIILLGDQIDDIRMVEESKREKTTRVSFLLDSTQLSSYKEYFDFVCTDDTSYDEIGNCLFEHYKASK